MTDDEISRALESLIREDAQRPSEDQVQDLIDAGVIDKQGRVLIGSWNMPKQHKKTAHQNGKSNASRTGSTGGT
jgi:ribosomal protein L19E